jgi:hypothetical protein
MSLVNSEFESILADSSKRIEGDIVWKEDEDRSPAVEFRAEILSDAGWPLFIRGSYNRLAGTLTYALILKSEGRVYALDMGKEHHNPSCDQVGETHKHRWTERYRDKDAYVPKDITASVADPCSVWGQFCMEANIRHRGALAPPPPVQENLYL